MRYEVFENNKIVCSTNDETTAVVSFQQSFQKISNIPIFDSCINIVEFRDNEDKKFLKLTHEIGQVV